MIVSGSYRAPVHSPIVAVERAQIRCDPYRPVRTNLDTREGRSSSRQRELSPGLSEIGRKKGTPCIANDKYILLTIEAGKFLIGQNRTTQPMSSFIPAVKSAF